jgi:acyl-CoA synthetase (NDP forming)
MVGLGGVQAEVIGDVAVELAPVDRARALSMLQRLVSYRLLTGFRGAPPVDVDAAAEVVTYVSEVLAEHPEIEALELNPVLVTPSGCLALDAHLDGGQWPYPEGDG